MPDVIEFLIDWVDCVDLLLENLARIWRGNRAEDPVRLTPSGAPCARSIGPLPRRKAARAGAAASGNAMVHRAAPVPSKKSGGEKFLERGNDPVHVRPGNIQVEHDAHVR